MKPYRHAIFFLALLAIIGALIVWDEYQSKRESSEKDTAKKVFSVEMDDVQFWELQDPQRKVSIRVERSEDRKSWLITQPIRGAADNSTVESLLRTVIDFKFERLISDSRERWSDYGLDEHARRIILQLEGGQSKELIIGKEVPVGYSVYFALGDQDSAYMGSQYLLTATSKSLIDLRDRKIFALKAEDIVELRYEVGGELVMSAHKVDSGFEIVQPAIADGDTAEISDFIAEVARLRADDFLDQPDASFRKKFASARAVLAIALKDPHGAQTAMRVAGVDEEFWLMVEGRELAYRISVESMKALRREIVSFRKRQLIDIDPLDVQKINIDGKEYLRKDQDFVWAAEPDSVKTHISNLLTDLAWAKAENFIEAGNPQIKSLSLQENHRIEFHLAEGKETLVFKVWRRSEDNKLVVKINNRPSLYLVRGDLLANIEEGAVMPEPDFEMPAESDLEELMPIED